MDAIRRRPSPQKKPGADCAKREDRAGDRDRDLDFPPVRRGLIRRPAQRAAALSGTKYIQKQVYMNIYIYYCVSVQTDSLAVGLTARRNYAAVGVGDRKTVGRTAGTISPQTPENSPPPIRSLGQTRRETGRARPTASRNNRDVSLVVVIFPFVAEIKTNHQQ